MSNQSFKVKSGLTLTPVDLATLSNPQAGDLACDINDSNKIKRYDAATSAWAEVGSGGVGSLDILFAQDFESASLSTFSSPSGDQVGLVLDTVDPLHGKISAKLTHDASVNQFFKEVKAVDRKFRGQAIVMRLNVKSSASAGNVTISVYDETNAASLLSSTQLQLSNDVDGISNAVSFTIPSTSSSISYTITALPEAGSPVTFIDDIVAELSNVALLETSVEVPVMTAWQGYTPTFQGFGTPTNIEFEYRQVGENVEIRGKFVSGVSTAVEARIGLPAGLTSAGTSLIPSLQVAGFGGNSTNTSNIRVFLIEPSVTYMTIGISTNGTPAGTITKVNGNDALVSSATMAFKASIPCAGLSATTTKTIPLTQSGLVQEADSMVRLDTGNGYGSTNTRIRRFSNITQSIGSDILYQDSATLGASFTVQTSGVYEISYTDRFSAASGLGLSRNTTSPTTNITGLSASERLASTDTALANYNGNVSWQGYLSAGDVIRPHTDGISGGTSQGLVQFTITKQGSLKQVSVSSDQKITIPTSELRFEGASARGTTDTRIVRFDTLAKVRGDAFTIESDAALGTRITMKKAGKLNISAFLQMQADAVFIISKNQANRTANPTVSESLSSAGNGPGAVSYNTASWSGFVDVGDVFRINADVAPTSNPRNQLNLSFQEQDISVSVTNTLPQFSESDSSIRVDSANGYGSVGTRIRRFSNIRDNIGSDIEYVDSATNGASFTVKNDGVYTISYTDNLITASTFGLSKNVSSLTTNVASLPFSELLGANTNVANLSQSVTWSGYLSTGDIIRPHGDGTATGANTATFTISKVGKPNVTGVDVTPFVNVPMQLASRYVIKTFSSSDDWYEIYNDGWVRQGSGLAATSASTLVTLFVTMQSTDYSAFTSVGYNVVSADGYNYIFSKTTTNFRVVGASAFTSAGSWIVEGYGNTAAISALGVTLEDSSRYLLTPTDTFSTDTASLSYASSAAYTLSTLQNAPVGTYITFTYAANTNTRTQTTTRPTQTDVDMNANGILIYPRAYNAASTAAQPAAIAIQIGKGLKGRTLDLYKSVGRVTSGNLDYAFSGPQALGASIKDYNEVTGVLTVDAAFVDVAGTTHNFVFSDVTTQTSGYLVINASKSPALTGIGLPASVYIEAANNAAQIVIAASGDIPFIDVYDPSSIWNGTQFVVPEDGIYQATAGIVTVASNDNRLVLYKNGSSVGPMSSQATLVRHNGTATVRCVKGDTLSIRLSTTSVTLVSSVDHRLTITKIAKYI